MCASSSVFYQFSTLGCSSDKGILESFVCVCEKWIWKISLGWYNWDTSIVLFKKFLYFKSREKNSHWFSPQMPRTAQGGPDQARSSGQHLSLPHGWQGHRHSGRKLFQKQNSWDLNPSFNMVCWCHKLWFNPFYRESCPREEFAYFAYVIPCLQLLMEEKIDIGILDCEHW